MKLGAAALANLGTAFIVGGAVGPVLLGHPNPVVLVLAVAAGFVFHLGAQGVLHYVADDPRPEVTTWVGR